MPRKKRFAPRRVDGVSSPFRPFLSCRVVVYFIRLVLRNALRHRLRTLLTIVGIVVAIAALGLLRTIIDAWYAGANASSSARLITRSSVSLVFSLPLTYAQKIRPGARVSPPCRGPTGSAASTSTSAISFRNSRIDPGDLSRRSIRSSCSRPRSRRLSSPTGKARSSGASWPINMAGRVGDQIPLRGTIYAGTWTFNLRGIYDGKERSTAETQMFFHWDYLNEIVKKRYPAACRPDRRVHRAAQGSGRRRRGVAVDRRDVQANSLAETLTETENAFQLGFVAMSEAILLAIQAVSFVVIVIIMAVMANTMAMTARERSSEYATLKALGFGAGFVALLILAESMLIARRRRRSPAWR